MNIRLLGFTISVEMLILIGVVYLVLMVHTFGGCANVPRFFEFLSTMRDATADTTAYVDGKAMGEAATASMAADYAPREGFAGASTNQGITSSFSLLTDPTVDTKKWMQPNLIVKPGQTPDRGVQDILNRPSQPVPLPEGQMLMFANTPFKPECCPNTYSNGSGCACMTVDQYNYLTVRGGNNVPYSEY